MDEKHLESKDNQIAYIIIAVLAMLVAVLAIAVILLSVKLYTNGQIVITTETTNEYSEYIPEYGNESEMIAKAVIAQIGTETEESCFGYSVDYVLRVITAECNNDEALAFACCTALQNECFKLRYRQTPEQAMITYNWTTPADFISDEAKEAFIRVFVYGEIDSSIKDATLFYNPEYCDCVPEHESYEYITTIHNVRFFNENLIEA